MTMNRSYAELSKLTTFEDRFEYLKLNGSVGEVTFGYRRYLNQVFYKTRLWLSIRERVFIRDLGCDLGIEGRDICGTYMIHHIVPLTDYDIENRTSRLTDLDNLITTTHSTHNAIHYGDISLLITDPIVRTKNDTCPWKQ